MTDASAADQVSPFPEWETLREQIAPFIGERAVSLLAFAVFDAQINEMRRMKSDDDGFVMKVRLLWSRRVAWRDVDSWSRSAKSIDVTLRNGRTKRFRFNGVENRDAAMEWAAAQFTRRVSAPDELPARQRDAEERDRDEVFVAGERGAK